MLSSSWKITAVTWICTILTSQAAQKNQIVINIPENLPTNYYVANLRHFTRSHFPGFSNVIHYKTDKIFNVCDGGTQSVNLTYFCVENGTLDVKTNQEFRYPNGSYFKYKFPFRGYKDGRLSIDYLKIMFLSTPVCEIKTANDKHAEKSCSVPISQASLYAISGQTYQYNFPSWAYSQHLVLTRFKLLAVNKPYHMKVFNDRGKLIFERTLKYELEEHHIDVSIPLYKIRFIKAQFLLNGRLKSVPTKMLVPVYFQKALICRQADCLRAHYTNKELMALLVGHDNCSDAGVHNYQSAVFDSCTTGPEDLATVSVVKHTLMLGEASTLVCNVATMHSYEINWYRYEEITDEKFELSLTTKEINVTAHGFYVCAATLLPRYERFESNKIPVFHNDTFEGKLSFSMTNFANGSSANLSSESIINSIQTEIVEKLSDQFDSSNVAFREISLRLTKWHQIHISGNLYMAKSNDVLRKMTYSKWIDDVTKNMVEKIEQIESTSVETEYACMQMSIILSTTEFKVNSALVGVYKVPCGAGTALMECAFDTVDHLAHWKILDVKECERKRSTSEELNALKSIVVSADNVFNVISHVEKLTSLMNDVTSEDIRIFTDLLDQTSRHVNGNATVADKFFTSMSGMLNVDKKVLGVNGEGASKKLMGLLGDVGESMATSQAPYTTRQQAFSLGGVKLNATNFGGFSVHVTNKDGVTFKNESESGDRRILETSAYISLPSSLLSHISADVSEVKTVVIGYTNDNLFTQRPRKKEDKLKLNSYILSVEIRGQTIKDLPEPVRLHFKRKKNDLGNQHCGFWDEANSVWSREGCTLISLQNSSLCQCNHLTNFAILFNAVLPPDGDIHERILSVISYVGASISITGALLTFITYLVFPMLREKAAPKVLMNLCLAVIFMNTLFLLAVEAFENETTCKTIAVLLQYFFLSVFTWGSVEAFHSTRGIVYPMEVEIPMFMQKACAFAWGIPLILSAIGFGIWNGDYGKKSCVTSGIPFYATLIVPIVLLVVFNLCALILIVRALNQDTKQFTISVFEAKVRLRIILFFMVLFGITWSLGFLVIANQIVALQYLFCISSGAQGAYIFVMYCVRNKRVPKLWGMMFKGNSVVNIRRKTLRSQQMLTSQATGSSRKFRSTSSSVEYDNTLWLSPKDKTGQWETNSINEES